ncbi:MAG TPA: hypothetical protein VHO07_19345 [Streptosporangiaceae bacterium]|nr:hypothetical protein [Streptosporangiaceae bacterium]
MSATFQNSAMVLSIGIFFTLIILGLASTLPATLSHGLIAQGVPSADAAKLAALPPVSIMFAALLGYNPISTLLGSTISKLPASHAAYLTGHTFFPALISAPFHHGLDIAFDFAAACLVAAVASLLRGRRYVHEEHGQAADAREEQDRAAAASPGQDSPAAPSTMTVSTMTVSTVAVSTVAVSTVADSDGTSHDMAVASGRDDLEGGEGRVGRIGDPTPVGRHLA